tara:strand:- start:2199 stop:2891 length:693 start_codon:yes stop_codon:yes gene_type:complete
MGYLNNQTIIVDAVLTKKGRELLSRQDGSFNITQFALGDDEIDYSLFNENHPNGSQFVGEAIENLSLLEAIPDDRFIMKSKLVTLPRGTSKMPVVTANISKVTLSLGSTTNVNPTTLNFNGTANLKEPGGYIATIADRRLLQTFTGTSTKGAPISRRRPYANTPIAESVLGNSFTLTAINSQTLFGTSNTLLTSLILEGRDSGARVTIPVEINKEVIAVTADQNVTGTVK